MDGQGCLKDETIKSCLKLSNIVMIHFNKSDIKVEKEFNELKEKLTTIKELKKNQNLIVILLIRDGSDFKILKRSQNVCE